MSFKLYFWIICFKILYGLLGCISSPKSVVNTLSEPFHWLPNKSLCSDCATLYFLKTSIVVGAMYTVPGDDIYADVRTEKFDEVIEKASGDTAGD